MADELADIIGRVIDNTEPLYQQVRQQAHQAVLDMMREPGDVEAYRESVRRSEVRYFAEPAGMYIRDWLRGAVSGDAEAVWQGLIGSLSADDWRRVGDMYLPDPDELV